VTNGAGTPMPSPWLYRYAIFLATCTALLLLSGAYITSSAEQLASTDQSIFAGSVQIHALQVVFTLRNHAALAIMVGILTLVLVAWVIATKSTFPLRVLTGGALATFALDALVARDGNSSLSPVTAVVHALLSHVFLSVIVMVATLASPGWNRGPEIVDDRGHSSLSALALVAPFVVLLQIALGECYRHNILGVLPHICGAFVATAVILLVCLSVTQDFADISALNSTGVTLLCIVLAQICAGIMTFTMRLQHLEDTSVFLFSSMFHMLVGSLTLAATVVMAMQVRRNVRASGVAMNSTAKL
jgi:heme A synthase